MKRTTPTLQKTAKMMTAALLTAGLLLPTTTFLQPTNAHAASMSASSKVAKSVNVRWNDKAIGMAAFQASGDTFIPVKALAKAAGLSLTYDKTSGQYTLGTSPNRLVLSPYNSQVWIGANGVGLQTEGRVKSGSIYVPLSVLRDYAGMDGVWNASTNIISLKPSAASDVTFTEKTLKQNTGEKVVDIRYPELSGDAAGIAKINAAMKKHAQAFLTDFEAQVKDFGPLPSKEMYYEADGDYLITYNKNGFISIVAQDYSFYGGAHGMTIQTGYNFDVNTGKEVTLDQLLKANPNYRKVVDKQITQEFKKRGILYDDSSFQTIGKSPEFYVTNSGFTIFFQQYEYTPYAAGLPSFDIKFSSVLTKGTNPFAGL
ncbi:PdaC/SigV domain-containing protein [Saccharibacillus sp. JS10]|uniref:PdaC/SigV domain-containing protein n=1 Tax=Saccharibacillus sp. JS10 TaxID=2950552 RepID=UPI00210E19B2|nr:DUF4163 domain-containing protein [Saccharibacillus sp. JS10]MCQ4087716.1 DUF4163 domain-containing protein [Saccharibacillus sp. JS10]